MSKKKKNNRFSGVTYKSGENPKSLPKSIERKALVTYKSYEKTFRTGVRTRIF